MQKQLYIFNPWHDMALANFTPYYKISSEIVRMSNDLSFLPVWYAPGDALIKIPDASAVETFCSQVSCFSCPDSSASSYPAAAHPGTDTTSRTDSDKPSQALFLWRGSSAALCPTPVALTGVSRLAASGRHLEQKLGRTADATPGTEMQQNHDRCTWASRDTG